MFAPSASPHASRVRAGSLACLVAAVLGAFSEALHADWILFDDPAYVTENPHVATGPTWANARWFLTGVHGGNWHPLTSWSHLLDVSLFGLSPAGPHAVNVLLHAVCVLLVALVFHRLSGAWWRSVLLAALFGLHPLRVESVAWISERKDVLSMALGAGALLAWLRWVERPSPRRYALALVLYVFGLAAKPMLVSVPLLLMVLDAWPLGRARGAAFPRPAGAAAPGAPPRAWWELAAEKWPFFACATLFAVLTLRAQGADGAVVTVAHTPLGHRLANALVTLVRYARLTLWPADLAPFHPDVPLAPGVVLACAALVAAVTALAVARARRWPWLAAGWTWYVVTLLPVIGLVKVGGQAYADRYTYLPSLGLLLVALGWPLSARAARAAAGVALLACVPLALATARQVALWRDTTTLFEHTLRVAGESALAHDVLGTALVRAGRDAEARAHFEAAVRLEPASENPWRNLGELCARAGDWEGAARCWETLRAARPGDPTVLLPLALARSNLGRPDLALPLLRSAEAAAPADAAVQHALGQAVYAAGGSAREAVGHLRRALALRPAWSEPHVTLALVLATDADPAVRDPAGAVTLAARAVALTRGIDAPAHAAHALALAAAGRAADAAGAAHAALGAANTAALPPSLRERVERLAAGGR